jgi:putative transposase
VSEAARNLAMSRFRLIQPYLEERRSLQLIAAEANLSFRTAQRWVSQYRKLGLVAFVRKARDDRGRRRVVSQKIKAAIEGLALERPPLPIRSICRQVRAFAQATGQPMPCYGCRFANYLAHSCSDYLAHYRSSVPSLIPRSV